MDTTVPAVRESAPTNSDPFAREPIPRCGECGYPARDLPSFTCPECGSDLRAVGIVAPGRRERLGAVARRAARRVVGLGRYVVPAVLLVVPAAACAWLAAMFVTYYVERDVVDAPAGVVTVWGGGYKSPTVRTHLRLESVARRPDRIDVNLATLQGRFWYGGWAGSPVNVASGTVDRDAIVNWGRDQAPGTPITTYRPGEVEGANRLMTLITAARNGGNVAQVAPAVWEGATGGGTTRQALTPWWAAPAGAALWVTAWLGLRRYWSGHRSGQQSGHGRAPAPART